MWGVRVTYKDGVGLDKYNTNRIELGFKYRIKGLLKCRIQKDWKDAEGRLSDCCPSMVKGERHGLSA